MRSRFIPVLLLDRDRRLVKTVRFGERTYIGDPFNVIRLFNEKEVDEICILDIDATSDGRLPDAGFIAELASECFMPLSYGGGLRPGAPVEALARGGVEKFVIGSAAGDTNYISDLAQTFGSQAIVGCVDYRDDNGCQVHIVNGKKPLPQHIGAYMKQLEQAGVGELLFQSIDRDGMRDGMDLNSITQFSEALTVPLVALGGAREVADLDNALAAGASAAASGSAFCFIGNLRAVLVTYPTVDALA